MMGFTSRSRACAGLAVVAVLAVPALGAMAAPAAPAAPVAKLPAFRAGIRPFPASIGAGKSIVVDPRGTRYPRGDTPVSHTIIFGDGSRVVSRKALAPVRHTYQRAGTYTITLVVTDRHHRTVRVTRKLRVIAPNPAVPAPTTSAPAAVPSTTPLTGPLAGTVKHAGTPVSGVLVVAVPFVDQPAGATAPTDLPELRTTTAGDGTWALPSITPGKYEVYVDADPDAQTIADPRYAATSSVVTVANGTTAIYDAVVGDPVTVVGTMSGPSGGVPGNVSGGILVGEATVVVYATAGADGSYRLLGLPAGLKPYLDFLPDDDLLSEVFDYPDYSADAGQTVTQNQAVVAAGAITGTVTTSAGAVTRPLQFSFTGEDDQGNIVAGGYRMTSATGAIDLGHLPTATYTLTVNDPAYPDTDADYAPLTSGGLAVVAGKSISAGTLTLKPSDTISGTVSELGTPTADGFAYVTLSDGTEVGASTDAAGNYVLRGLPDGTYTVDAYDKGSGDSGTLPGVMASGGKTASGENVQLVPGSGSAGLPIP